MEDYSQVRGFNYSGWNMGSKEKQIREFGYARQLQLNSVRIWLLPWEYEKDPAGFLDKLVCFVRTGYEMGITTMPILFNGNGLNPEDLKPAYRERLGERYVRDVVTALKDEPGLFMWDVMNEPSCNDYIIKAGEKRQERWEEINDFLHTYCSLVKSLDSKTPITIGHTYMGDVEPTVEDVDVFCFHDYLSTRREVRNSYEQAVAMSQKTGKQFMNSELCCLCRANPYDMALDICREYHTGWYLFELMITGYWEDVHGIFYEDGTVRDPSIPAAVMGFSRRRTGRTVRPNPNKEGYAQRGIQMIRDALEEKTEVFRAGRKSLEDVLEAAEFCANLLEACEMVPMCDAPTIRINRIRESQDMQAARELAWELAGILKEKCQLV